MSTDNPDTQRGRPHAERLMASVGSLEISIEPDTPEALLHGEPSTHFPVIHNRRKDDEKDEEVRRLRAILHALDRGEPYPEGMLDPENPPVEAGFYKQF